MSRQKTDRPETLAERVTYLIAATGGTMRLAMAVDPADIGEAEALLARSRKPGAKLIVITTTTDKDIEAWKSTTSNRPRSKPASEPPSDDTISPASPSPPATAKPTKRQPTRRQRTSSFNSGKTLPPLRDNLF